MNVRPSSSRVVIVAACVVLTVLAMACPTSAAPTACKPFDPRTPEMTAEERASRPLTVADRATKTRPLTHVVELPPTVIIWVTDTEVVDRSRYVNIQLAPGRGPRYLSIRAEWPAPSESEIDFYLRDESGERVAASQAMNPAPKDAVENRISSNDTGGDGWEGGIVDVPAWPCDGFTLEIESVHTLGEDVTLHLWVTR